MLLVGKEFYARKFCASHLVIKEVFAQIMCVLASWECSEKSSFSHSLALDCIEQ